MLLRDFERNGSVRRMNSALVSKSFRQAVAEALREAAIELAQADTLAAEL